MITEEKIKKFLQGSATTDEAEEVYAYLLKNPDELNKYISPEEWAIISNRQLTPKAEATIDKVVFSKTAPSKIIKGFRYLAAASLLGIIALAAYILFPVGQNPEAFLASAKEDSLVNSAQAIKIVKLVDGSVISLYPQAVLYYPSAFNSNDRTVKLKGKAKFDVAGDQKRPFTVISKNVTTTALGTVFIVDDTDNENIVISLIEGNVVLKPLNHTAFKEVYLSPNESCIINKKDYRLSVQKIEIPAPKNTTPATKNLKNTQAKAEKTSEFINAVPVQDALDFNQTPLYHVFNVLAGNSTIHISYNNKDVSGLYFTGKFNREENIDSVLKIICDMNNLKIIKQKDKVQISKK